MFTLAWRSQGRHALNNRQMVVVHIDRHGKRKVSTFEPKDFRLGKWRTRMNVIASFKSWHDFRCTNLYQDILNSNKYHYD